MNYQEKIATLLLELDMLQTKITNQKIIAIILLLIPIIGWLISLFLFINLHYKNNTLNSKTRLLSVYNAYYLASKIDGDRNEK